MGGLSETPERERRSDRLLRDVLRDLLVTAAGFLLAITVVALSLDTLSVK